MQHIIEKLFAAADRHGEDTGEPDHTVGDLQGLFRLAWSTMTVSQRLEFLRSSEIADLLEMGACDECNADDLISDIESELSAMESRLVAYGYQVVEGEGAYHWTAPHRVSRNFPTREEAVVDAYQCFAHGAGYQMSKPTP